MGQRLSRLGRLIYPVACLTLAALFLSALDCHTGAFADEAPRTEHLKAAPVNGQSAPAKTQPAPPNTASPVLVSVLTSATSHSPHVNDRDQIDSTTPILDHYPDANVDASVAIVTVPDPRVPRHRREYDNAITAINQGMLRNQFVLDRYVFPWREDLDDKPGQTAPEEMSPPAAASKLTEASSSSMGNDTSSESEAAERAESIDTDFRYGLMIYRRDSWRDPPLCSLGEFTNQPCQGGGKPKELRTMGPVSVHASAARTTRVVPSIELRAVYVVPETATYGVQEGALFCALRNIDGQMDPQPSAPALVGPNSQPDPCASAIGATTPLQSVARQQHVGARIRGFFSVRCHTGGSPAGAVEIIGPAYSGSMDSIREVIEAFEADPRRRSISAYCLLSPSATSATNWNAALTYRTLARSDADRLDALSQWLNVERIPSGHIVLLYEATEFGKDVCPQWTTQAFWSLSAGAQDICHKAVEVAFPANIADIRYGLEQKRLERQQELDAAGNARGTWLPAGDFGREHLSLEEGAENGSEFPESAQSPLTSASSEQVLARLLNSVRRLQPEIIIIVATDVRDRLFLMQTLNAASIHALVVDLTADNLSAHRDFIYASRGMLAVSSAPLTRLGVGFEPDGRTSGSDDGADCSRIDPRMITLISAKPPPCTYDAWATEQEALMFEAVRMWDRSGPDIFPSSTYSKYESRRSERRGGGGIIIPYIVTRSGLLSLPDLETPDSTRWLLLALLCVICAVPVVFARPDRRALEIPTGSRVRSANAIVLTVVLTVALAAALTEIGEGWQLALIVAIAGASVACAARSLSWSFLATCSGLLGLAILLGGDLWSLYRPARPPLLSDLLDALDGHVTAGMSPSWALAVGAAAVVVTVWISSRAGKIHHRSDLALAAALQSGTTGRPDSLWATARVPASVAWGGGAACLGLAYVAFCSGWRHVTVFGARTDFAVFAALAAVTTQELVMLIGAWCAARRAMQFGRIVDPCWANAFGFDPVSADSQATPWSSVRVGLPPPWVPTPALAGVLPLPDAIATLRDSPEEYHQSINDALHTPWSPRGLEALYAMLTDEITVYRHTIIGAIVCALAGGAMIYLFPISEATPLVLTDVGLLLLAGLISAYETLQFEGDRLLSNILCNRPRKREWSFSLIAVTLLPFIVLAGLIAVAQLPGVLDAEGGLVQLLMKQVP